MAELYPGLHRVPMIGAKAYLLVEDRLTLIDTGYRGGLPRLTQYLARIGRKPEEIDQIIITHAHPDHVGSLPEILAITKASVFVHEVEAPLVEGAMPWPNPFQRQWMARAMAPVLPIVNPGPTPVEYAVEDGFRLATFGGLQFIHTPGHTPGSMCVYVERHRLLIAGDILEYRDHRLGEPNVYFTVDPAAARASIVQLAAMPIATILLAHFRPVHRAQQKLRQLAESWLAPF